MSQSPTNSILNPVFPDAAVFAATVRGLFEELVLRSDEEVADLPERPFEAQFRTVVAAELAVGGVDVARQISLVAVVGNEALVHDQADQNPNGEGAPAEAESVDLVAIRVCPAEEGVKVTDIARKAEANGASEEGQRPEGRGAHAVVIEGELPWYLWAFADRRDRGPRICGGRLS